MPTPSLDNFPTRKKKGIKRIRQRLGSGELSKRVEERQNSSKANIVFSSHKTPLSMDCVNAETGFLNLETLDCPDRPEKYNCLSNCHRDDSAIGKMV